MKIAFYVIGLLVSCSAFAANLHGAKVAPANMSSVSVPTIIPFTSSDTVFDPYSMVGTDQFTLGQSGVGMVAVHANSGSSSSGAYMYIEFRHNGGSWIRVCDVMASGAAAFVQECNGTAHFESGAAPDTLEFRAYSSTGNVNDIRLTFML